MKVRGSVVRVRTWTPFWLEDFQTYGKIIQSLSVQPNFCDELHSIIYNLGNHFAFETAGWIDTASHYRPPPASNPDHRTWQGILGKEFTEGPLTLRWWPKSVFLGFSEMHHFCQQTGPRTSSFVGKIPPPPFFAVLGMV